MSEQNKFELKAAKKDAAFGETQEITISGYLHKKTRDGRWQRRWFETNGVYLTYYKTRKLEKLLAALSLPQVGDIKIITDETSSGEGLFSLELNQRTYILKTKSPEDAKKWVEILLQLKEIGQSGPEHTRSSSPSLSNADSIQGNWQKSEASSSRNCCCKCM